MHPRAITEQLLALQVALAAFGNAVILLWSLGQMLLRPGGPWTLQVMQAGHFTGWLAAGAGAAAAIWYVHHAAPARSINTWAGAGLFLGVLAACTISPWDAGNGSTYHMLLTGWILAGSLLLTVGWSSRVAKGGRIARLAEFLPMPAVRNWVLVIGLLVLGLARRGLAGDPAWPFWSTAASLAVAVLFGALAVWSREPVFEYVSGLIVNVAGMFLWAAWLDYEFGFIPRTPFAVGAFDRFLAVQVLCLAFAASTWLALEIAWRAYAGNPFALLWQAKGKSASYVPFKHVALAVALNLLAFLIGSGLASDFSRDGIYVAAPLVWCSLAGTIIALVISAWDSEARFTPVALYAAGLLAVGLILHGFAQPPRALAWTATWLLALYLCTTSLAAWTVPRLTRFRWALHLPETSLEWSEPFFLTVQGMMATVVITLSVWTTLSFETFGARLLGTGTVLLLLLCGILLTGAISEVWWSGLRTLTLSLGVLALADQGWSCIGNSYPAPWMHRSVMLLAALAVAAVFYETGLRRLLPLQPAWIETGRRLVPSLGVLALIVLLPIMAQEFLLYDADPAVQRTPLAGWAIATVAVSLAGLISAGIGFAVAPAHDPLGPSERGRTAYVYVSEVLLVFLFLHLRLNLPHLFPRVGRLWPFVALAIAYLGAGLSELFRRKGLEVLARPLQQTGVFLPLLPLLAFWAKPPVALQEFASAQFPGLHPLLNYLVKLPQNFRDYALVWFLVSMLYAGVAITQRSFGFAFVAALAGNFGFWAVWYHHQVSFLVHPQLWLIPVALILLAAEHQNREQLGEYQSLTLRYVALLLLYVSSTADMFIAGLGNSVSLPLILAVLSIVGVLAGILLQVRAFLFTGFAFLFLVVFSMIWHAAVDRYQTWVWWASGVVLGAAILALFAVFEKRRNDVLKVIEQVKQWE